MNNTPKAGKYMSWYWELRKRGDSCPLLAFLTPVVTRNGERPPTESLRHIAKSPEKSKKSCIFADGNQGWEILSGELGLEHRSVTHQVKQFTKPVQTAKTISRVAGTQTLDHSWGLLEKWLPDKMAAKDPCHKGLIDLFKNHCMGVQKTGRKCFSYDIPGRSLVNKEKRREFWKIKVVGPETEMHFALYKTMPTTITM